MKRLLFLFTFATLLCAGEAWAVCAAGCTTCVSPSASRADVNTCVTNAATGATITVPSGTQTWATPIVLLTKDLTIVGASVITCTGGTSSASPVTCSATNNTNITCSTGVCFTLPFTANHNISGFSMTVGGSGDDGGFNYIYGQGVDATKWFRIHHNRIVSNSGWAEMQLVGGVPCKHPQGVIDNNILVNISVQPQGGDPGDDIGEGTTGACQMTLWAEAPPMGKTTGVVYVERNHIQNTAANINSADSNHAGRYVFRFNNIVSGVHCAEIHGVQGYNRGSQLTEVYENAHSGLTGFSGSAQVRGGTGVVFNNRQTADFAFGVLFTNDRSELDDPIDVFGYCNGTKTGVDQNTSGQRGWRCRDQPGVGYDATLWVYPGGAWNQVVMPWYVWGNLTAGAAMTVEVDSIGDVGLHIQANRDFYCDAGHASCSSGVRTGAKASIPATCTTGQGYWASDEGFWNSLNGTGADGVLYKCTATNTWTPYYVPAPYPHPLVSGLAAPTGLTVK